MDKLEGVFGMIGLFFPGIILASPILILSIIFLYLYKKSKISIISVQFAGGEIAFDVKWFSQKEVADFQQQLRLAKDKAVEEAENAVADRLKEVVSNVSVERMNPETSSIADELRKYGDLLSKGLISKEEFEKLKKNLV